MKALNSSLELSHYPVMLKEVVNICSPKLGGNFVDCTFGGGGYSEELLKFKNTNIIAIDRDQLVANKAKEIKNKFKERFSFFIQKFSNIDKILENKKVDAIIFDLGISSIQLLNMSRGFSFKSKDNLDMSMGLSSLSAKEILNNYDENYLKLILKVLGEEKEASTIVKNIIKARKLKEITKVSELVAIIEKSKKKNYKKKINVCTKTFQALRIFVNKEVTELIEGMIKATQHIKPGGKIIMISFHSIEDKIIKFYFRNYANNKSNPSRYSPEVKKKKVIFFENYRNNIIKPSQEEILANPPSRSAKLRYVVRNNENFEYPQELKKKFKRYLDLESKNDQ